jgi:hypothetical protein
MSTQAVPRGIDPHGTLHKRSEMCCVCKEKPVRAKKQRTCKDCHSDLMAIYRLQRKLYLKNLEEKIREMGTKQ